MKRILDIIVKSGTRKPVGYGSGQKEGRLKNIDAKK